MINEKYSNKEEIKLEINLMRYLNHPNIIKLKGFEKNIILMEYLEGQTLDKYIGKSHKKLIKIILEEKYENGLTKK